MIIKTKIPKEFATLNLPNEDKCPYCIPLFRNRKGEMICLSHSENDFDIPYTNFFADLNSALSDD